MGRAALDYLRKRGSGFYRFRGFSGGAPHFVILSGEKRPMLKNGLSKTGELSRKIYSFFPTILCSRETTVSTAVSPMIVIDHATPTCR